MTPKKKSSSHVHGKAEKTQKNEPGSVLRLRLLWRNGKWQIAKRIELKSKMLPNTAMPDTERGTLPRGVWFEAIDEKEKVIVRRRIVEPLPLSVELLNSKGKLSRFATVREKFLLDLLMPDDPEIVAIRVLANPNPFQPKLYNKLGAITELVTLDLRDKDEQTPKEVRSDVS